MKTTNNSSNQDKSFKATRGMTKVLTTAMLLERPYAAGYLAKLLKGDLRYGLRKESHQQLESFGSLENYRWETVLNLLRVMEEDGYLTLEDEAYGTLSVSEKGKAFLETPELVSIEWDRLSTTYEEKLMANELKTLRRRLSDETGNQAYEIYTNRVIEQLIQHRPKTLKALKSFPGLEEDIANKYGHMILQAMANVKDDPRGAALRLRKRKAYNPTHQSIKVLFESGMSLEEIAANREMNLISVRQCLENLHMAKEIDLKQSPWIESQMDEKTLHRASEYFREVADPKLKEAHEVLGISYDNLWLSRLYVNKAYTLEDELQMVA